MTPPKLNLYWNLVIYDQSGQAVTHMNYTPNESPQVSGDMNALIDALPSITDVARFFTDPDEQVRNCYNAYRNAWDAMHESAKPSPTWEELIAIPHKASLVAIWRKTAAAAMINHSLN